MPVMKSSYRRPCTPEGLRKVETGELDFFDVEVYSNYNTGMMEQYFEEKMRKEAFERSKFDWKKVAIGIMIGIDSLDNLVGGDCT